MLESPHITENNKRDEREDMVLLLKAVERRVIVKALEATRGNCQEAAKALGIGKTTVYRKIKKFGIENRRLLPEST